MLSAYINTQNIFVTEFTNNYMGPLLGKLSREKKKILLWDFNINILNFGKDVTDFVDTMYTSSFYPAIDTSIWIITTSKC